MKHMKKALMVAIALCISGQSVCSDATKTGWCLSSLALPKISQSQKNELQKWALPVAIGAGGLLGIWTAWTVMKHSAQKKNKVISGQQMPRTTYCQELNCWQIKTHDDRCSLHVR